MKRLINEKIKGLSISPGLSYGCVYIYRDILEQDFRKDISEKRDCEKEYSRIENAISEVKNELKISAGRIKKELDQDMADIFHAQATMLTDPTLNDDLKHELFNKMVCAEEAVKNILNKWMGKFKKINDRTIRKKADDLHDLGTRLVNTLCGIKSNPLEKIPEGSIIAARRLLPSDTVSLRTKEAAGVLVEHGSAGSHAALLTREMGIPAIGKIKNIFSRLHQGDHVIIDALEGFIVVNPDEKRLEQFMEKKVKFKKNYKRLIEKASTAVQTKNGTPITVSANIAGVDDANLAAICGADSIGLFRSEGCYLSGGKIPDDDELYQRISSMLKPLKKIHIVLRLLDIGGDKYLPFIDQANNDPAPLLGLRGVRLLIEYPELLATQLRVFLKLSEEFNISILVPMITLTDDMNFIRKKIEQTAEQAGIKNLPPIGAMIETPAAALQVKEIVPNVDFLSIGTNDLTQYTMAAGRENHLVEKYFNDSHPAIFRLLELICAEAGDCPVCLCGELAGNIELIPRILKSGIRHLSIAPPLIPFIKDKIKSINLV